MMAVMPDQAQTRPISFRNVNPASAYAMFVVLPTLILVGRFVLMNWSTFDPHLFLWTALVAGVEFVPAPAWRGLRVSLGFPILFAVALTYSNAPGWAAAVALIGSADPQEIHHQTTLLKALFNRCQVAIAVFLASVTFQALGGVVLDEPLNDIIPLALLASLADYLTNLGLVMVGASLVYRLRLPSLARQLPRLSEFLISYVGLAILGAVLAKLYSFQGVGLWSVLIVIAPLLFARQMFLRSFSLEEAHVELKEREGVLRELSNTMAEERADERLQIAGYLHDDLAQVLFRLSLQVDIAKKLLDKGDLPELQAQLDKIRLSKQDTSDRVRALIRDLHRSPLGAKGLAESLESFTDEVGRDSGIEFHHDVEDIQLPAPIALLIFHIAREGVMNALKHANATNVSITVHEDDDDIVLTLIDDGVGFDAGVPGPEGHYGMAMLRERAKVGGGTIDIQSAPGQGTTITVRFPTALLQRDHEPGTEPASSNGPGRASPDMKGTTSRAAEGSRDSVPA
jgi:signal transduction histidine kinase